MINMLVLLAKDRENLRILAEEEAGEVMRHLLSSYCHPINSLLGLTFIETISVQICSLEPGNNLIKQTA
jgi:hypothetical protein